MKKKPMYYQWRFPVGVSSNLVIEESETFDKISVVVSYGDEEVRVFLTREQWYKLCSLQYSVRFTTKEEENEDE